MPSSKPMKQEGHFMVQMGLSKVTEFQAGTRTPKPQLS